ncbi:MAG: hypothetical protein ACYCV4_02090 [Dermatophilaceae bacterium]
MATTRLRPWHAECVLDGQHCTVRIVLGVVRASGTIRVDATEISITSHGAPITATMWRRLRPWSLTQRALAANRAAVDRLIGEQMRADAPARAVDRRTTAGRDT